MRPILPKKCHLEHSWNCDSFRLQRPRDVIRVVVNYVKMSQQPDKRGRHQFVSSFVEEPFQGMQFYDDNPKPLQNLVTDVQKNKPFCPVYIHLENQIPIWRSASFDPRVERDRRIIIDNAKELSFEMDQGVCNRWCSDRCVGQIARDPSCQECGFKSGGCANPWRKSSRNVAEVIGDEVATISFPPNPDQFLVRHNGM